MAKKTRLPEARQARRAVIAKAVVKQIPNSQIAAQLGVTRQTVWNEVQRPETQALIQSMYRPHHARLEKIVDRQIANVERALTMDEASRLERIEWLTERIAKMRQVIEERAEEAASDETLMAIPGMLTGTMVHRVRALGSFGITTEYEVDAGLLKELREHEKQLRDELNDFGPNLKAVERARDLLEMAEGTKKDGDSGDKPLRWQGTLEELLVVYRQISTPEA